MSKNHHYSIYIFLLFFLLLSACGGSNNSDETADFVRPTPPAAYQGVTNPYQSDPEAEGEGGKLYQTNCSSCHGNHGKGDGAAARALDPPPTNLALTQADQEDGYLYWRISEGGLSDPFNSTMPAWKQIMSEDRIWKMISFIRTMEE